MRFHCDVCKKDFTTMSMRGGDKRSFSFLILDKMICPNCGARNKERQLKPLKQTRHLYQPKRRSLDTSDYGEPVIILHQDCQNRIRGTIGNFHLVCDGCPSAFNCLTGNVDDGITNEQPDYRQKQIENAKAYLADKERKQAEADFEQLVSELGKCNFGYRQKDGVWYAHFGGTVWKLSEADVQEILNGTFQSNKTIQIKNTLNKRGINLESAQKLLRGLYENK